MAGRITPANADYPFGSSRDETSPGANDGTPYFKGRSDDILGLQQALLTNAGLSPSGNADTVLISQYFQALMLTAGSARRNLIVDGRLDFWYEGILQTVAGYGSSTMFANFFFHTVVTVTREVLARGVDLPAVPTAEYFHRTVTVESANTDGYSKINHSIEGTRSMAGKKGVISFYAKTNASQDIAVEYLSEKNSGTRTAVGKVTTTGSWERYEFPFEVPVRTGILADANDYDTISIWFDAGSDFDAFTNTLGHQTGTFDIACVQFEEGVVATRFEEERPEAALQRVNRYFWKYKQVTPADDRIATAAEGSFPGIMSAFITLPTPIRTLFPVITTTGLRIVDSTQAIGAVSTGTARGYEIVELRANLAGKSGTLGSAGAVDIIFTVDARL